MRIDGSIPFHVARAYGVPAQARAARQPGPTSVLTSPPALSPFDRARNAAADQLSTETRTRIDQVVAGRVSGAIDEMAVAFSGARSMLSSSPPSQAASLGAGAAMGSLPMYTRAADRIEAAVRIERGRMLDVRA